MGETTAPVKTADRVNALLLHVRSTTGPYNAAELAGNFDVPESLVREILAQRRTATRPTRAGRTSPNVLKSLSRWVDWADRTLDKLISRPALFTVGSTLLAFALALLVRTLVNTGGFIQTTGTTGVESRVSVGLSASSSAAMAIFAVAAILHMTAFFRLRRSRYPLLAGLTASAVMIALAVFDPESRARPPELHAVPPAVWVGFMALGLLMLGLLYSAVGSLVSIAGGWLHMNSEERRFRSMSRLEMLERYFEIEEALETAPELGRQPHSESAVSASVRDHPFVWIVALAVIGSVVTISLFKVFGVEPGVTEPLPPMGYLIASFLWSVFQFVASTYVFWRAGSIPKALALGFVYNFASSALYLLPDDYIGRDELVRSLSLWVLLVSALFYTLYGGLVGLAAKITRHAKRQSDLKKGEPSALVRELVRLEERLVVESGQVCVMSVDVAGSTKMKSGADPMDAEYSFAAYQAWVSETCRSKGGRVHSTAGDGAIVSFGDARSAFEAGCVLQVGIAWLNQERNRLPSPFRLRVGLHEGEVAADLDKLQFTRVIDVAAHVESVCPIGGLAATEEVAGQLSDVPWAVADELVDGHRVFMIGSDAVPRFGAEAAATGV